MYHSTYSFPKEFLLERARTTNQTPPAGILLSAFIFSLSIGRASFYRELLRPELADICKNAEYQNILAEHMREHLSSRMTASSRSSRSCVPPSNRSRRL